jgi:hypothetical protein
MIRLLDVHASRDSELYGYTELDRFYQRHNMTCPNENLPLSAARSHEASNGHLTFGRGKRPEDQAPLFCVPRADRSSISIIRISLETSKEGKPGERGAQ